VKLFFLSSNWFLKNPKKIETATEAFKKKEQQATVHFFFLTKVRLNFELNFLSFVLNKVLCTFGQKEGSKKKEKQINNKTPCLFI